MKIAIFGGTGRTGRHVVEQALAAGHDVVALTRDPQKLASAGQRLTVVQGDARDAAAVARVVAGAEAVVSVLGPTSNRAERAVTEATRNILAAMTQHGIRRLVLSTGAGVRDPNDAPGPVDRLIGVLLKLVSRNVYEDMAGAVDVVRASDVDWTIVRVPMLTDGPRSGRVAAAYVGKGTGMRISRADLAAFLLEQVEDRRFVRQAPAISSR